jgi:TonB family protein
MTGRIVRAALVLAFCGVLLPAQSPPFWDRYAPPQVAYSARPVYPELAKRARIQGTVRLAARIGTTGKVESLRLISGHPFLVDAAMNAVKRWRYRPAMFGGRLVAATVTIDIGFTLSEWDKSPVVWV